jgi:putative ABC transport system permease protein
MELFGQAIKSLKIHKLRSLLATLGIVFGVAAVISMVSINESTKRQALKQFEALGISNIRVKSTKPLVKEKSSNREQWIIKYGITLEDVDHLRVVTPGTKDYAISRKMRKNVWSGTEKSELFVFGVIPSFRDLNNLALDEGRFIDDLDTELKSQVCVLGSEASRRLFRSLSPVGETIKIQHRYFKVVGVLNSRALADTSAESDVNLQIYIPYTTCLQRYGKYNVLIEPGKFEGEEVYVDELVIAVNEPEDVIPAAAVVRGYFERTHPKGDFEIIVPLELLRQREQARKVFNLVMLVIASISLFVGGIGIMNIMLANVAERTKEIGTRRALGARRQDIRKQFLIESIALTLVGGFIGIFVGIGITAVMTKIISAFLPFEFTIEPTAIIISFVIATAVGITFGTYPAVRAAALSPLEALRTE